ncbi:MAG: holliday junction DNA helicase RuvA [Parcubacteria group bacterium Licking1014_17]|nr:MAG: holliday junction DNA helicase RuvA [Parcubacteria group bacterium Licking1014_17]
MIGYLEGSVQFVLDKQIIVNVNGVGYRVTIPDKMKHSLPDSGGKIKLYTYFVNNQRDGTADIYGFTTPEELQFFEMLTSVTGIGPKSAQGIVSSSDLRSLQKAIMEGNDAYLTKFGGIGPKTSQRIIVELKNKIAEINLGGGGADLGSESEAIDALVALGYSHFEAREALSRIRGTVSNTEEKIKEALKSLDNKKTK